MHALNHVKHGPCACPAGVTWGGAEYPVPGSEYPMKEESSVALKVDSVLYD